MAESEHQVSSVTREAPATSPPSAQLGTPFEALGVLAQSDVQVTPRLMHVEMFTMRGLLTLLWHQPADGEPARRAAVIACGGAMGGLLGPGEGLYHQLGILLAEAGVPMIRVGYRRPNDLDACCLDVAAAAQLACATGAEQVVVMGHSFGGAVAVRVGVIVPDAVAGVVTFATQSAGCEIAGGLQGRPLLMFHGDRDEILPVQCSQTVRAIAGEGDLHVIPGDGHLLARSGPIILDELKRWLPTTLGIDVQL